uniref:Small ribosomal subunit protein uS9c n=1 Tax=Euglena anabaena TaxID=38273 RepID=A0A0G3F6Q3_EUGAN|nr:ribosomal protein S9 [Euglenaria anabaena]AKJ83344.1 ribosomal protein S9 [Euglenaria anabaena]
MEKRYKTVGRRKSAIAKVIIAPGNGNITINGKYFEDYVQNNPKLIKIIQAPLILLEMEKSFNIKIHSLGGGLSGQSDAIKLGIARALYVIVETESQRKLKINGLLTRNPLCKERRKYGLKKARKAPQFSKR